MKFFPRVIKALYFCVLYYKNINMIRALHAILVLAILVSCSESYDIKGTSSVPTLDGRMLYLKVYHDNDLKSIDSCDIVHGKFHFKGQVDSARMATLFMDDESIMPVVLESGDISIKIDNTQQKVSGSPLNEKLFLFIESYNRLEGEVNELGHQQSQAIMNGKDMSEVNANLAARAEQIAEKEDKLITSFIVENFDNALGPGVFFMMTAGHSYPELSPWIEDIMSKATEAFKNDPYVKDYYEKAQQNQAIMNGTASPEAPVAPQAKAPTPNEMAAPQPDDGGAAAEPAP